MYDPMLKQIIISKDVVFEEDKKWDWSKIIDGAGRITLECGDDDNLQSNTEGVHEEEELEEDGDTSSGSSSSEETEQNSPNSVQGRVRRAPTWMEDYVSGAELSEQEDNNLMMCAIGDPMSFEEAVKSSKWKEVMDLEIKAIEKNGTWELTTLPVGAKKIGVKWVFKTKLNENGEVDKYKARLVAKGYSQQFGIDYTEVFAPVSRWDIIRMILALAACKGWSVYQLDVKCAFLHGDLKETVYRATSRL